MTNAGSPRAGYRVVAADLPAEAEKIPPLGVMHPLGPLHVVHRRPSTFVQHRAAVHTEHVVTYLVAGHLELEHGGPVTMRAGSVLLIPAGVPHRFVNGSGLDYWAAAFCAGCLSLDEEQPLLACFGQARLGRLPVVPIPEARRPRVKRLFAEMSEELDHGDATSEELARCLLLLILGEVRRALGGRRLDAAGEGKLVGEALAFIQRRCLEPISLKDVAAAVGRSAGHVSTVVKEATGYTVGEWISSGRVAEAAGRLLHTDDSLDEIALSVGWQDRTHFARQFKKTYGVTPAAWRRCQRDAAATRSGAVEQR